MIKARLKKLKDQFVDYNLDGYVIPKNDEFFQNIRTKIDWDSFQILKGQQDMQ